MVTRDINSVVVLVEYGSVNGISKARCLSGSGICEIDLIDATLTIEAEQELQVINNLVAILNDPVRVGIEAASHYSLTCYGMFGYALLASSTVKEAIEFGIRYLELTYVFSKLQLLESDSHFKLKITPEMSGEQKSAAFYRDVFAIFQLLKEVIPFDQIPLGLELQVSETDLLKLEAFNLLRPQFSGGITYDCPDTAFVAPKEALDYPLPKAHPVTAQACEKICYELLRGKHKFTGVSSQIRKMLISSRLQISMSEVSDQLYCSERTLHRKLKKEGTSWRRLRDSVAIDLAEELLKQPLKIGAIATQLGFSDTTNFSHSFKRVTGISPAEYRAKQAN